MPVDFHAVFGATCTSSTYPRLSPFNYLGTNHTEGPRKWYISSCPEEITKVYLPAKGLLYDYYIRFAEKEGIYNGENVIINVSVSFRVSSNITIKYGHLTLRDEIRTVIQDSPNDYAVFDAGTHIGYMYTPSLEYNALDFGVRDFGIDSGLTRNPEQGWATRANPLDYFTEEIRGSILAAYQETYDALVEEGVNPYSDMEDSRLNFNEQNKIWGVWFKDDVVEAFGGSAWSVVNLRRKANLHQESYWRTLEEFPSMSGLFYEAAGEDVVGKALYEGRPIGVNKFYMLSGNDVAGVARIEKVSGRNPRTVYLKYEVQPNTDSKFDDKLTMESFPTLEDAMASQFSIKAVLFRRDPCRIGNPIC